jgi:hypothetical protein
VIVGLVVAVRVSISVSLISKAPNVKWSLCAVRSRRSPGGSVVGEELLVLVHLLLRIPIGRFSGLPRRVIPTVRVGGSMSVLCSGSANVLGTTVRGRLVVGHFQFSVWA